MVARTKVVVGPNGSETIPLTAAENAERDAEELAWVNGQAVRDAAAELARLEGEVTNRRLRDSISNPTGASGKAGVDNATWLTNQEALIAAQRAIIVGV